MYMMVKWVSVLGLSNVMTMVDAYDSSLEVDSWPKLACSEGSSCFSLFCSYCCSFRSLAVSNIMPTTSVMCLISTVCASFNS